MRWSDILLVSQWSKKKILAHWHQRKTPSCKESKPPLRHISWQNSYTSPKNNRRKKTSACFEKKFQLTLHVVKLSIKRVVHLTNLSRKDTKFHWGETKYHKLSHLLQYFFCRCKALVSQTVGLHKIKWSLYYAVVSQSNWPEWAITQHYSSLLGTELRWIDRSMSPHQLFSLKVIWFRSVRIKLAAFQAPQGLFSRYTMVAFSNPKLRCFPL